MGSVQQEKVLLTGGSGFIASHILDTLLSQGFFVVVTSRSPAKGQAIIDSLDKKWRPKVSYAIIEDVGRDGVFDKVFQSEHKFDYIIHTASPCTFSFDDPVKDILDPAIKGTTGILKSIKAYAPTVKRVVITSSSAAILNPREHAKVYSESNWSPFTWEDAMNPELTYAASKKFAEQAAWKFIEEEKPTFSIATINNSFTFGPVQRQLTNLETINLSNIRVRDLVQGRMKEVLAPTKPVFTWVDVRDVALAHVRAMTVPDAAGKRFYIVSGHFSNKRLADIIKGTHPQLRDLLPGDDAEDDLPADVYQFDNSRSRTILGLQYRDLETSIRDTVDSILAHQSGGN